MNTLPVPPYASSHTIGDDVASRTDNQASTNLFLNSDERRPRRDTAPLAEYRSSKVSDKVLLYCWLPARRKMNLTVRKR
jgi:hypothetical protein